MSDPVDEAIGGPPGPPRDPAASQPRQAAAIRHRSWAEVRWRQLRHAPRPVVRAVASSLLVAVVLGLGYLAYDVAIRRGAILPGGDLRTLYLALDVATVLLVGSILTWLIVPQPRGSAPSDSSATRSLWSAALGFFAAVPISYLVLVVIVQVLEPMVA